LDDTTLTAYYLLVAGIMLKIIDYGFVSRSSELTSRKIRTSRISLS
jgi:hypothetical protein